MDFKPSIYQRIVFNKFKNSDKNLIISAVAGSGKTTTIVSCIDFIPKGKDSIFFAFNNHIVKELQSKIKRYDVKVSTLHSFCWKTLQNHFKKQKLSLNKNKAYKYTERKIRKNAIPKKKQGTYYFSILSLVDLVRQNLIVGDRFMITKLADYHDIWWDDLALDMLDEILEEMDRDKLEMDYTDMIYRCIKENVRFEMFDYIFVDESQDLSKMQQEIIKRVKKTKGRMIAVGDKHQCQPSDTNVLFAGGIIKKISELRVGDGIVSYDKNSGSFTHLKGKSNLWNAKKIEEIQKRPYFGNLIKIETENNSSRYTPEHRCILKFREDVYEKKYVVYLMSRMTKKGLDWRIGKTKLYDNNGGNFGPRVRLRNELGTDMWILKVCENNSEAIIWEEIFATKYGISQKCFTVGGNDNKSFGILENVNFVFSEVREYVNLRVAKLFDDLKLSSSHPFVSIENKGNHYSKLHMFECYACNIPILKDIVNVLEIREDGSKKWSVLKNSFNEIYKGFVYSLKVEKELYVADNILTHNSIYGFAGADAESYDVMKTLLPDTEELKLSINYRCGKKIIEFAQKYNDQILPFSENKDGIVKITDLEFIQNGDWIICRNVKPLVITNLHLISRGIKSYIKGSEIGTNLIHIVNRNDADTVAGMLKNYDFEISCEIEKLKKLGMKKPQNSEKIDKMNQKYDILDIISRGLISTKQLINKIKEIFKESGEGVMLSTIHKTKGLENKTIYFLCPELIPSRFATKEWQLQQEKNLFYVGITRAKENLFFIPEIEYKMIESDFKD